MNPDTTIRSSLTPRQFSSHLFFFFFNWFCSDSLWCIVIFCCGFKYSLSCLSICHITWIFHFRISAESELLLGLFLILIRCYLWKSWETNLCYLVSDFRSRHSLIHMSEIIDLFQVSHISKTFTPSHDSFQGWLKRFGVGIGPWHITCRISGYSSNFLSTVIPDVWLQASL